MSISGWPITRMKDWQARLSVACCAGVWITAALWMTTGNPWCSVFACAAAVGWLQFDNWATVGECHARQETIMELEKQVVALRTTMHDMAATSSERVRGWRSMSNRDLSTRSL